MCFTQGFLFCPIFSQLVLPAVLGRGTAVFPFEQLVKIGSVHKAQLPADVVYLYGGVTQKLGRLAQAHPPVIGGHGKTVMPQKYPVDVPGTCLLYTSRCV